MKHNLLLIIALLAMATGAKADDDGWDFQTKVSGYDMQFTIIASDEVKLHRCPEGVLHTQHGGDAGDGECHP